MESWKSDTSLVDIVGSKLTYHVVLGGRQAGKSTVARYLAKKMGWVLIEWTLEHQMQL